MEARLSPLLLAALLVVGCSQDHGSSDSARTLANCTTSIADDAPEFFKRYFRCVTVTMSGSNVVIHTQNLPPHPSNYYGTGDPNYEPFDTSRGSQYHANPNSLVEKDLTVTIPLDPVARGATIDATAVDGVVGTSGEELPMGPAGVALDSVALFNPLAAPGDDIAEERFTFDRYEAHPAPDSSYHYHTASPGPLEVLQAMGLTTATAPGSADVELYGIMCDGTVVLGCTELDGSTPDASDFDAQNGHVHDLADGNGTVLLTSRYHTHICTARYPGHPYTPEIQYYQSCDVSR